MPNIDPRDTFLQLFRRIALVVALGLVVFTAIISPLSSLFLDRPVAVSEIMFVSLLLFALVLLGLASPNILRGRNGGNGG